jgi:hypothetical protein
VHLAGFAKLRDYSISFITLFAASQRLLIRGNAQSGSLWDWNGIGMRLDQFGDHVIGIPA